MDEKLRGYETVVVSESGELIAGESDLPQARSFDYRLASTELYDAPWREVRSDIDPEEFDRGEHVATIYMDLEKDVYWIEYHIEEHEDNSDGN